MLCKQGVNTPISVVIIYKCSDYILAALKNRTIYI
jgi:hypothetical protein